MLRNLMKVSGFTAISRVLGFLRDILIARYLGSGLLGDAFFSAFRFPLPALPSAVRLYADSEALYGILPEGTLARLRPPWRRWEFFSLPFSFPVRGMVSFGGTAFLAPDEHNAFGPPKPLYALNLETGEEMWRIEREGFLWTPPAVDERMVCAVDNAGYVAAVHPETGSALWNKDLHLGDFPRKGIPPVLTEDLLLLVSPEKQGGALQAFSRYRPSKIWEFQPAGSGVDFPPSADAESIYICADKSLYALSLKTGKGGVLFEAPRKSTRGAFFFSPLVTEYGLVIAYAENDEGGNPVYALALLRTQDGRIIWKQTLHRHPYFPPLRLRGDLYFADREGALRILDLKTGDLHGKISLGSEDPASAPVAVGEEIFLLTKSGRILGFTNSPKREYFDESLETYLKRQDWRSAAMTALFDGKFSSAREILKARREEDAETFLRELERMMEANAALKVFLSYAKDDYRKAREVYEKLTEQGIEVWMDTEKLLPGAHWDIEIQKALSEADVILLCLSGVSVSKEGYVQKELKEALRYAEEKPDGTIFLIPLRLEECEVPWRLREYQWVDWFGEDGFSLLMKALKAREEDIHSRGKA
jgi:outer membrane protein assembly factor BamB